MAPRGHLPLITVGLTTGLAMAEPVILYDSGQTAPLAPYAAALTGASNSAPAPAPVAPPPAGAILLSLPPIVTPELTPGVAAPRPGPLPLPQPLFLVGADPFSLRWLTAHRDRLRRIGAVGLLVQAPAPTDLATVRAVAGDLVILPMPGSDLARWVGLTHYPVLLTSAGVSP